MSGYLHVPSQVQFLDDVGNVSVPWLQFFVNLASLINLGYPPSKNSITGVAVPQSVTIITASLGIAQGNMIFTNGILTKETAAT